MSYFIADGLQAVSKHVWHIPWLFVQWKTPDDGQRNCPKYVEFYSKKYNWGISACSWFYYKKVPAEPLLCLQWKTPDDGQRNCPKHVEFYSKKEIWEISASGLVLL